jgi:hypothetical protein
VGGSDSETNRGRKLEETDDFDAWNFDAWKRTDVAIVAGG